MEKNYSQQFILDENYLNLFRELIHYQLGIFISKDKDYLLQSKIGRLVAQLNYKSVSDFYYNLKNGNKQSIEDLIYYITTTHTYFFRENIHLKILKNDILIKKKDFYYIWCAASSTGEEVYSIIIELLENGIQDFLIIATDINKNVLVHLKKGIYNMDRMRILPDDLIRKYFKPVDDKMKLFAIKSFLKKFFIAKKINLVEDLIFEKKFNYIFCRNVLIYFDRDTQIKVIDNLLNNLDDYGYLFVGQSESLFYLTDKVESVYSSVYSKKK